MQRLPAILLLGFFAVGIGLNRDIFLDPSLLLPRDNLRHHFPVFLYLAEYWERAGVFPEWIFSLKGGIPTSVLATSYVLLAPYRWLFYWTAGMLSPELAYKLSLLSGTAMFLFGIFLLTGVLRVSKWLRYFAVFLASTTSVSLTFLHQEQALGTVLYVPYLWWAAVLASRSARYLFVFIAIFGASLNLHYPQMMFIYGLFVLGGVIASGRFREWGRLYRERLREIGWRGVAGLVAIFFVAVSPLLYSYGYRDKVASPLRAQESIEGVSFAEYERFNRYVPSSLEPVNLFIYGNFKSAKRVGITELDDQALFMTFGIFFALLILGIRRRSVDRLQLFMIAALVLASLGIHAFLPKAFWYVVPGIEIFRQWFHFTTLLNLHLLFAIVLSLEWSRVGWQRWTVLGIAVAIGCHALWGSGLILERYRSHLVRRAESGIPVVEKDAELFRVYPNQVVVGKGLQSVGSEMEEWLKTKAFAIRGNGLDILGQKERSDCVPQWQDGRWRMIVDGQEQPFPPSNILQIETQGTTIRVERVWSMWKVLVGMMWIGLVFAIFLSTPFAERIWNSVFLASASERNT